VAEPISQRIMKVKEVAGYLRVSPGTIYTLIKRDGLPGFRIGGEWRVDFEALKRWYRDRERR
jgi:excisionase family DNA binding protein